MPAAGHAEAVVTGCPADNTVAELLDGTLAPAVTAELEAHLDRCGACSEVLAQMARSLVPAPPGPDGYRLRRELDDATWDAECERDGTRVVIAYGTHVDATLAAMREPHVVPLHAHGDHAGRPFVAYQPFGVTERAWRAHRSPSSAQTLAVWRTALLGLAAIHDAGGTFELSPDRVMVAPDGEVRISPAAAPPSRGSGYVAPERLAGAPTTALADQFAACVAIWESLAGTRPFAGATPGALAVLMASPPVPPADRHPAYAVLARGLAHAPARRWPSVRALHAALVERPPARGWRRLLGR